jgi:RNA polymerase sigma factor (sigma-70 family)
LRQDKDIPEAAVLYEKFAKDIFRYAFSILKDEEDAKDAMQEVFRKYLESKNSFRGNCSQKTFLLVIARNYCFNKLKSRDNKNERLDNIPYIRGNEPDIIIKLSIEAAMKKLTPEQNELLYLKEYEDLTYKEISDLTNLTIENVKIKLYRARLELKKILKD